MTAQLFDSPESSSSETVPTVGFWQWLVQPSSDEEVMQIEGIFHYTKLMGLGVLVYFFAGIYAVYDYIDTPYIVMFLFLLFGEIVFKIIISEGFKRAEPESRKHRKWKISFSIGTIYFSIVYGLIALVMFLPMPRENHLVVFAVFLAVACALAACSLFMQRVTSISFIVYVAPVCVALIVNGTILNLAAASVIFLCVVNVVFFNRQIKKKYSDVFTLFRRNEELLQRLQVERKMSDSLRLEAEKAVANKNRFIATASHDLRQPLHAIGLFNHALRHMHLSDTSQDVFESMQRSIDALNDMFDSLLDISRLDSNSISPNLCPISVDELFESIASDFQPVCEQKGLKLIVQPSEFWVLSDPSLLRRILQNVLANAVKYCQEGQVKLSAYEHDTDIFIVVEDTGEGIDQKHLDLVFNEFQQLGRQNGESTNSGVGLGLSIVKRLCNLLDHNFELVSEPAAGTRFSVTLEKIDSQDQSIESLQHNALDFAGTHVLVIDDDPNIVAGLSQVLSFWQCSVDCYDSADTVLASASKKHFEVPDVILCDYQLGNNWNGLQLLDELLPQLGPSKPSVFIISGESSKEALAILDNSEFPVLAKPVRPTVLRNVIAHSVGK